MYKFNKKGKEFLSEDSHEFGAVCYYVTVDDKTKDKDDPISFLGFSDIESELRIQDCNKSVTLEFSCDVSKVQSRINKINTLINELSNMRDALIEAEPIAIKQNKELDKAKEDKKDAM